MFSLAIYQAKAYGAARRAAGLFADGYALNDGIASLTGGTWDATNKKIVPNYAPGADQTKLSIGSAISSGDFTTPVAYPKSNAFDANAATKWISTQYVGNQTGNSYLGWDFGGTPKEIVGLTIAQDSDGIEDLPLGSVKVQWSNDASSWTDVSGSPFALALDTSTQALTWPSVGTKRAWRILANANVATNGWGWGVKEITLLAPGTLSNFVLTSTLQSLSTGASSCLLEIEYNPIASIILGTDLVAEVTCDGGAHYATVSLTASEGQSGRILASGLALCTAGNAFGYRISSANGKNVELAGASVYAT